MDYVKDYLKTKLGLNPIGELEMIEVVDNSIPAIIGYYVRVKDFDNPNLFISYEHYAEWLEEQLTLIK